MRSLDRTLVADIATDPRKSAMAEALVRYTWRTESQLVAEGVETIADLEHLRRLGVGAAQGYVIARPAQPWPAVDPAAVDSMRQVDAAPRGRLHGIITLPDAAPVEEARAHSSETRSSPRLRSSTRRSAFARSSPETASLPPARPRAARRRRRPAARAARHRSRPARGARTRARGGLTVRPILVVDEAWRLVETITIDELLQNGAASVEQELPFAADG